MKPIPFRGQNVVYAKDQPEYLPLPAFRNPSERGEVVCCWSLSFVERVRLLFTGRIWLELLSFNRPLQPSFLTTKKSDVLILQPLKGYQPEQSDLNPSVPPQGGSGVPQKTPKNLITLHKTIPPIQPPKRAS